MYKIREAIVVEGRYDKAALSSYLDALILVTDGFGLFHDPTKRALLRRLADERGLVVLTDPDGAGFVIRNYIKSAVDPALISRMFPEGKDGKKRRQKRESSAWRAWSRRLCFRRCGVPACGWMRSRTGRKAAA